MSIGVWLVIIVVLVLVPLSVRERIRLNRYRDKDWDAIGEAKSTPISRALTNLVGMAGGIYLSIILLVTFLEIKVPERIKFGTVSLEPIATISILIAIIQPFVIRVLEMRNRF